MLLAKWLLSVQQETTSPSIIGTNLYLYGSNLNGGLGINDTVLPNYVDPQPVGIGQLSWQKLVTGDGHVLALRSDNKLFAWGQNNFGQLGLPDQGDTSSPTQIGTSDWLNIAAKGRTSYGITSDNLLYAWGYGVYGQLGNEKTVFDDYVKSWNKVAVGNSHMLAIRSDGKLFAWGDNTFGQLGTNDITTRSSAVQIGSDSWVQVSVGISSSHGIKSDGSLWSWGGNSGGQLATNDAVNRSSPVQLGSVVGSQFFLNKSFVQVSAGNLYVTAIDTDNLMWIWGYNSSGELGINEHQNSFPISMRHPSLYSEFNDEVSVYNYATATGVNPFPTSWIMVDAARATNHFSVGINSENKLFTWGVNAFGTLGTNDATPFSLYPVQIGDDSWSQVWCGRSVVYAVRSDNTMFTWGSDVVTYAKSSPTQIGTYNWSVFVPGRTNAAIDPTGALYLWGVGDWGQLGNSTTSSATSPTKLGTSSWISVAVANQSVAAIRSDGLLFTWGSNFSNELGIAGANRSSPVQIGASSWTKVFSADGAATLFAIRTDGALFGWGDNSGGQIGISNIINRSSPTQVGTSSWVSVSVGGGVVGKTVDGRLFVWGGNGPGNLGLGDVASRSSPVQIGTDATWQQWVPGASVSLGIKTNNYGAPRQLYTWGGGPGNERETFNTGRLKVNETSSPCFVPTIKQYFNYASAGPNTVLAILNTGRMIGTGVGSSGQLGNSTALNRSNPTQISSNLSWSMVSVGDQISAGLTPDNKLYTWGNNSAGQLGDGTTINKSSPVQIGTSSWSSISAGGSFFAAINDTGKLFTWGLNNLTAFGPLGLNDQVSRSSPTQVGTSSWVQAYAGISATAAILSGSNSLFTWGRNVNGILGISYNNSDYADMTWLVDRSSPTQVGKANFIGSPIQVGVSSWQQLHAGTNHVLAYRSDNLLFGWGDNTLGQLGDGTRESKSSPVQLGSFVSVSAGDVHSLGIAENGWLYGWGSPYAREDYIPNSSLLPYSYSWTKISSNENSSIAVRSDGALFAWGFNQNGILGTNDTINKNYPIQIGTGSWVNVSMGYNAAFAIDTTGALYGWGVNSDGILGTSDTVSRSSPVQIGSSSWTAVSAGSNLVAIRADGGLFMSGYNTNGQLGVNDRVNRSSPVQIGTSSWTNIASASTHTLALRLDRALFAWGLGDVGQIGNAATINRSSPVQVGASSWVAIATGGKTSLAVRLGGGLFTWGTGINGLLGSGSTAQRNSPVQVGTSSWAFVSQGTSQTVAAITSDGRLFTWGDNSIGQLGTGTTTQIAKISSPVAVASTNSWTLASVGLRHMAAIANNSIYVWGENNIYGQLGTANSISTTVPILQDPVLPVTKISENSWTNISAGFTHNLGIDNVGSLYGWGNYVANSFETYKWSSIKTGNGFSLMLDDRGLMYAMGVNNLGQLGLANTINRSSPVQIGTSSWTAISVTGSTAVAIRADGTLWAWGSNSNGKLGQNSTVPTARSSPVQIGTSSWVSLGSGKIGAATGGIFAIRSDNALFGWGASRQTLGIPGTGDVLSPTQIGTSSWTMAGYGSGSLAIRADGTLWGWGTNASFTGFGAGSSSPVQITSLLAEEEEFNYKQKFGITGYSWTTVSASSSRAIAIASDGGLYTWGTNVYASPSLYEYTPYKMNGDSWISASAGGVANAIYLAAIRNDGALFTWGINNNGQLGIGIAGTAEVRSSPVQIGTSSWTLVHTGNNTTYAIKSDGTLWSWGIGTSGELGNLSALNRSSPVQIGTDSWTYVTSGFLSGYGIKKDNTLWAWGQNNLGQLGDRTTANKSSPVQISTFYADATDLVSYAAFTGQTLKSWVQISSGFGHSSALDEYGSIWVTGRNSEGQLGLGDTVNRLSWVKVGNSSWSQVSAGYTHTMGIRSDGRLFVWGGNANNESGIGYATSSPTQIGVAIISENDNTTYSGLIGATEPPRVSWASISINRESGLMAGISSDGGLYTLGRENNVGQLGNNSTIVPELIKFRKIGNDSWSQVGAGSSFVIALKSDNTLWGWGLSSYVGANDTINRSSPTQIGTSSWTMISVGGFIGQGELVGAIRIDGGLFTWGNNFAAALGTNDLVSRSSPTHIGTSSWTSVYATAGSTHGAIRSDGRLFMWGRGAQGEIGDGTITNKSSPVGIGSSSWICIASGRGSSLYGSTYAIRSDGRLFGWGNNISGQIADPATSFYSSPVAIGTSSWALVTTGGFEVVFAYKADKTVWAWGGPSSAYLTGTVSSYSFSSPVQIGTSSWRFIQAGTSPSVYAIPENDTSKLYMWGDSGINRLMYGQFGFGSQMSSSNLSNAGIMTAYDENPVSWSQIHAGLQGSSAIRSDGSLFTWGIASDGALGDGLVAGRTIPVKIQDNESWSMIHTGFKVRSGKKLSTGNKLWTWGLNNAGQLGLSDTINRSSPVQLGSADWIDVELGSSHAVGIDTDNKLYTWGLNNNGQLGLSNTINSSSPMQIGTESWSVVNSGENSTIAINAQGQMFGFGLNNNGQLGLGDLINRSSPVQLGTETYWNMITIGSSFSAGVSADYRALHGWGNSGTGAYGYLISGVQNTIPVLVSYPTEYFISVGTAKSTAAAVRSDGRLFTWGSETNGLRGLNRSITTTERTVPLKVDTQSWTYVSSGPNSDTMGAAKAAGTLFAWGRNGSGELGQGTTDIIFRSSPLQIGTQSNWASINFGTNLVFASKKNNSLFGWGDMPSTGIGNGIRINTTTSPTFIRTINDSFTFINAGSAASAAIRNDGALFMWGSNGSGQLGQNSRVALIYPTRVGNSSWSIVSAASTGDNTAAITSSGKLFVWGRNTVGQIGLPDRVDRSSPTQLGGFSYSDVDSGAISNLALIRSDRVALMLGTQSWGELGTNDTFTRSSPVQLGTTQSYIKNSATIMSPTQIMSGSWSMVSAGSYYSMVVRNDNALFVWGSNQYSGLITSPTQISTAESVSAGYNNFGFISTTFE